MSRTNLRHWRRIVVASVLAFFVLGLTAVADDKDDKDKSDIQKRIEASGKVLDEIMGTPDKAIPEKIMNDAKCVAVIPSMVRIAVGFGGSHGKGVATCRTAHGWSAPAPITITGGSWGLQLGGEAVDLIMIALQQVQAGCERFRSCGPGGSQCQRGYRLEDEGGGTNVLASSWGIRRDRSEWIGAFTRQG